MMITKIGKLKKTKDELFKLKNIHSVDISETSYEMWGEIFVYWDLSVTAYCETIKDYHNTLKQIRAKLKNIVKISIFSKELGSSLSLIGEDEDIHVAIWFNFPEAQSKQIFKKLFNCDIKKTHSYAMFNAFRCELKS